jgi:hypothetical protein
MSQRETHQIRRRRWPLGVAAVVFGTSGLFTASAADTAPSTYVATTPCRVVDTRPGPDNVGPRSTPLKPSETYSTSFVGSVGRCNIPNDAVAVVLNLAIVNPTGSSYLTVFPAGGTVPLAANLNFTPGQPPVSNSATVQIGDGGKLSFFNYAGTVDVVADVSGYYTAADTAGSTTTTAPTTTAPTTTAPTTTAPPAPTTQQLVMNPRAVFWSGSLAPFSNCLTTTSGNASGYVPITLPIGAEIQSFSTVVLDSSSSTPYSIGLYRGRTTSTGSATSGPLLLVTGGESSGAVTSVAGSSTTFPVTATDSYWIEINLGAAGTNALCSLSVKVTMP